MAGSLASIFTGAVVAGSIGNWLGILAYTAPSAVGVKLPRPRIEFDATASTSPTARVRVVLGNTGQAGTANNPVAAHGANPSGVTLGTGLRNLTTIGSGGTVIWEGELKQYGSFVIPTPPGMVVAPGTAIQIDVKVAAAANINCGWDGFEV